MAIHRVPSVCERCHKNPSSEGLPLDMLGTNWWAFIPHKNPSYSVIWLCSSCFTVANCREGRILGYITRVGKTRAYVKEEVFGPVVKDTDSREPNL